MSRYIVILFVLLLCLVVGCSSSNSYVPNLDGLQASDGQTLPVNPISNLPTSNQKPPDDHNWLQNAKISVGGFEWVCPKGHLIVSDKPRDWADCPNCGLTYSMKVKEWSDKRYYAGAGTVEYPLIVHNGNKDVVQNLSVITEVGESVAEIPTRYCVYGDAGNVAVLSDNTKDSLLAVKTVDGEGGVLISGFNPDDSRIITLKYQYYAPFNISYRTPDNAMEGYLKAPADVVRDWVVISDPTPLFAPRETKNIMISLDMPREVTDEESIFWQITPIGVEGLKVIKSQELEKLTAEYKLDCLTEQDSDKRKICEEKAEFKAVQGLYEHLEAIPEASLLVFLDKNSAISMKLVLNNREASDISLLEEFQAKGYVVKGDLREDKWEFWISVIDVSEEGTVTTEICSRWLITMKKT